VAKPKYLAFVVAMAAVGSAVPAHAELVVLSNGRTLSVKGHRTEGTSIVLMLRSGGELVCDATAIARIEPDEVPYPEPTEPASQPKPEVAASDGKERAFEPAPRLETNSRYEALIVSASARHGVDPTLIRAVIQVESNYQPRARSSRGARGLMQLMPATGRQYGVSNLYDPAANLEAGIRHLKSLLERFPLRLALAAYNAGEATVHRFGGLPPFAETRNYVDRILELVGRG
jgi:hypothetical protein